MAIGHGRGENKAVDAARQAVKMPLLDVKSLEQASGLLLHFTGGVDLSLYEVNEAVSEITRTAPQADVVVGATIDSIWNGRTQAILIVTGVDNRRPLEEMVTARSQMIIQPRSASAAAVQQPQAASRAEAQPAPVIADATGHLAEALFSQAIADANPARTSRVATDSAPPDTNNLDMPAFLRKRTLRDFERRK